MEATTSVGVGAGVGSSGIVHELLKKDNYENWKVLVTNYLRGQGLWDVVASAEVDENNKKKDKTWARKNAKALHIIQLSCGSEILAEIRHFDKAKNAWNHLKSSLGTDLKADPDIEQGIVDDSLLQNKQLHRYVESGEWNDAKAFINKDKEAIFSTSSFGRSVLHVAVIAGHADILKKLVKEGKEKLVKMQDNDGYTALALAADLTGNTQIAKYLFEKKGREQEEQEALVAQELLTTKTKHNQIPVLLAAAKGHKEMARYLYSKTPANTLNGNNAQNGVLLLTRSISAEIFDVALSLLQSCTELPLSHESDGLRPLNALAHMPSAFPSGTCFGRLQQFFYSILKLETKLQDAYGKTIEIVSHIAEDKGRHKTSFAGRFCGLVLNFWPIKLFGRLLGFVGMFVQNSILLKFSGIREIYDQKLNHHVVLEILSHLCKRISYYNESQLKEASVYDAMLQAAEHGIIEFIDLMRQANPYLCWATDKKRRGIFAHAILNRRIEVFRLIHSLNGRKDVIRSGTDAFGNTLLHLAGHLGHSSDLDHRSGAALQMQREIQWFKAVEGVVHPKCKEAKNADGKKPRELFSENHVELVKAGEKWAKDTASSFTLVGTLITTIMFAAAFTVPGGNNQNGIPLFLHHNIFTVFIIADALSLFTSSTSVLVFIGILTSRYAEKDFLQTLPLKLLFGLVALFLSVVSMMVAFVAALGMMLQGYQRLVIAAMSLASIPVIVLVPSQLRLFLEIFNSTIRPNVFSSVRKENDWH